MPLSRVFLLFFSYFFLISNIYAFKFDQIKVFPNSKGQYYLALSVKEFPVQEIILALKREKGEITFICEIDIYRKGFLKDELLEKVIYYKKARYNPEKNVFYVEDNYGREDFKSPEELTQKLLEIPSLSLPSLPYFEKEQKPIFFIIHGTLRYKTHLNEKLRYTEKEREISQKTSLRYVPY